MSKLTVKAARSPLVKDGASSICGLNDPFENAITVRVIFLRNQISKILSGNKSETKYDIYFPA